MMIKTPVRVEQHGMGLLGFIDDNGNCFGVLAACAEEKPLMESAAKIINAHAGLVAACRILATIADAYDDNNLDDEARKFWGKDNENKNTRPPETIELYTTRGGRRLLTLSDCLKARDTLAAAGEK